MTDPADPRRLLRDGVLDPDLLALLWILLEARTPVVVVGPLPAAAERVVDDLVPLLPAQAAIVEIRPDDDFGAVPGADRLGWRTGDLPSAGGGHSPGPVADPAPTAAGVLRVRGLATAGGVAGERARVVVRALAIGYGLLATMPGERLEDALEALHDPTVGTDADERSRLGVVLVLDAGRTTSRVVAAHYVRPVAVDPGGHIHRQPPAVLGTWNEVRRAWDDFAWGVVPELAGRLGIRPIDLEREQARRAALLRGGGATGG